MGKLFTIMRNAPKRTSALFAMIAVATVVPAALLAWGPDRPTYTIEHPADHVTFNSITNNPEVGDERNFVRVKEAGAANSSYADSVNLVPGKKYTVYMYYHNNAASSLNAGGTGIAKNVSAKAEIPAIVSSQSAGTQMEGYISASNATPQSVWDEASFKNATNGDIALRYVAGSATNHNAGGANGSKVADSIITTGAPLGYDSLNGTVPGCNQYAGYVTFDIVADQANFEVTKQVRKLGEASTAWRETASVNPGDQVEYLVHYKNTGTTQQNDVSVTDQLPAGVSYVAGSSKLKNANNPSGKAVSDNIMTANGLNISNYTAGSDAYVWFTAKVADINSLPCGPNTLVNKATVITNNGNKSDTANVTVNGKECQPEKIQVCELSTKNVITINEKDFDSKKHSKNLEDCKETVPGKIKVCELATKKVITIDETSFDASKHSKNLADCQETPVTPETPTELPTTGPTETILSVIGLGALIASIGYYISSRRAIIGR